MITCAATVVAGPATLEAFIPAGATVVLLPGLAGDIESEKNYADQLQTWLEILVALHVAPEETIVFADNPESVKPPANLKVRALRTSRKQFLGLGQSLTNGTNALVLLLWGHGGMQGRTPVFHVPGPRVTPADCQAIARGAPRAATRWVLLFRGSGRFATELNTERSAIIASEKETMFASDPVGMGLLLKIVRAHPEIGFNQAGDELGRATAAWYTERNLARTEEPTLWAAGASPRLLTPAENPPPIAIPEGTTSPAPAAKPATTPSLTTTNLSAAWQGITRVDPRRYPNAEGLILRRRLGYTLGSNPALASDDEEFIQVLTPEGKHIADFDFAFSPPDETVTFLDCEVLRPDGQLLTLDPGAIRDAAESTPGDYHAARRKIFSLPGVVPGAILHVHYRNEWKTFPLPYVSLAVPLAGELPVADLAMEVSLPREAVFHFALERMPAADPVIKQSPYGTTYAWRFANLPPHEPEALAPPLRPPGLMISTFPDWAAFGDWFTRISQLADALTPELQAKAVELTVGAKTDRERALAIYNFVTGLRYVAVPLGVNSFRPHAAANVLRNQYGDCKDKANLFNTLLRAVHLEAQLVLVPRFSQADDALPGFAFNHAISRLRLGAETLWVDTTDDVCRFGLLPPGDPGRKVLVVDGKSAGLTQLPLPSPRSHVLRLHGTLDCATNTTAPAERLSVTASGFSDYELRAAAQNLTRHETTLPLLALHYHPVAGMFGCESQSHTPVSAMAEDFGWKAEGIGTGLESALGDRHLQRAPFWLPKEWDLVLHRRQQPLFLNQGYPLLLDEEFEIALPARAQEIRLPAPLAGTNEPLSWRVAWQRAGAGPVTAHLRVELARGELTIAETPVLRAQLRALISALGNGLAFTFPPPD